MFRIFALVLGILFVIIGWLGYDYCSFQVSFEKEISSRANHTAENLLTRYEEKTSIKLLKNLPSVRRDITFKRGWVLIQREDIEGALREFREISNNANVSEIEAAYNATTLSLERGKDAFDKLAEEYRKILVQKPDDSQTKVNLEIVLLLKKKQMDQMMGQPQKGKDSEGKNGNRKSKSYRMKKNGDQSIDESPRY